MKSLAIDCRSISKTKTGVGNVLLNILKRLDLEGVKITLFFNRDLSSEEEYLFKSKGYEIEVLKFRGYVIWEQILFPIRVGKKYDYVWFPNNTGSIFIKPIKIATIHDVIFSKSIKEIPLSGKVTKDLARFYRKIVAKSLAKKAERIYTVSKYSKEDIIRTYNIESDKIKVIYNGLDSIYLGEKINRLKKENWILSFGTTEPRKNTELTIRMYYYFLNMYPDIKEFKLVLYGFKGYKTSKQFKLIKQLGLEDNVIIHEYISDDELRELYSKSKIFCYLSSFEGFGIPILESMSQMTPVVAFNNSSIKEVMSDSGILIDDAKCTEDLKKIANKIYMLINNEEDYNYFVSKGRENVNRFNWEKSVEMLREDLMNLMSN